MNKACASALLFLLAAGSACAEVPPAVMSLFSVGSQGWMLDGPEFTARAGATLNGDCDVNGDGYADLLIGATGSAGAASFAQNVRRF